MYVCVLSTPELRTEYIRTYVFKLSFFARLKLWIDSARVEAKLDTYCGNEAVSEHEKRYPRHIYILVLHSK